MILLTAVCRSLSRHAAVWVATMLASTGGLASAQTREPTGHAEEYARADIEFGARLYGENCDRCHGANGAGVNGVDLRSGKFKRATTDQQIRGVITNGVPADGMPAFKCSTAELIGMVAYLRNMNSVDRGMLKPGDPLVGKMLVETKGECLSCHRINGQGLRSAPDLGDIGLTRSAGAIERALLDPDSQMWPINRPVSITTNAGRKISGRRLNEDTFTVQLVDGAGKLISVNKSEIREFTVSTKSPMASYGQRLTSSELSDVIAYLLTLKGL